MKGTNKHEVSNNQIIEYLTDAAAHGGYCWDGISIEPGTAVTCLKTIARETGLSYYRVKKSIDLLVEAGRITITRHKCFAIITFNPAPTTDRRQEPEKTQSDEQHDSELAPTTTPSNWNTAYTAPSPTQPLLNRAARRRLARQQAKAAARHSGRPQPGTRAVVG